MNEAPQSAPTIGVFDSGFGGLTVLRELLRQVPAARYLYFGDTARLPYGSKSAATVAKYAISAAHFLEQRGAQMLVVACNTATALAFEQIRGAVPLPVIGVVEPGADAAARASQSSYAAVIATSATVASHAYQRALARRKITAIEKACPLLVPLVEEGWIDHAVTEQVAKIYLQELFADGASAADVLLLGCTHYPLLRPLLQRLAPANVTIVDSAESTAHDVRAHLERENLSASRGHAAASKSKSQLEFFATDSVEKFPQLGARFLGRAIEHVELVDVEL